MRTPLLLVLPLALSASLAGCSSHSSPSKASFSQPAASFFAAGPCRAVAGAVLALGKDAHNLTQSKTAPTPAMSDSLKANQAVVVAVQPGLSPALAPSFSELVIATGVVRLRADTNTYIPELATGLRTSYDHVVRACTGSPSPTASP